MCGELLNKKKLCLDRRQSIKKKKNISNPDNNDLCEVEKKT